MAKKYSFKSIGLEISGKEVEIVNDSTFITYNSEGKHLNFQIKYFTGKKTSFLGFQVKEKGKFDLYLRHGDFEIEALANGDEQTKQIKNLGAGALVGAVVAGPIGAAAGAYLGSKLKACPALITISKHKIKLKSLAPIDYLEEQAKLEFFSKK
jgi:hypothetical protein